jgi:steroid delta-isomerase-like uncharacterized protein
MEDDLPKDLLAGTSIQPALPPQQNIAHRVLVDRYFDEILNRANFSRADEILAPDFVFRGPSTSHGVDRNGLRQFLEETRIAFSNKHFTELDRISEGDRVALRFRMTGTQDGYFHGIPPLGVAIDVEGCDLITIHDGRIAKVRAFFDLTEIIREFLVPPPVRFIQRLLAGGRST